MSDEDQSVAEWLETRRAEGQRIDPATAEVEWWYVQECDPYGVRRLPPEYDSVNREHFARNVDSDIWVSFGDIPGETCELIFQRHHSADVLFDSVRSSIDRPALVAAAAALRLHYIRAGRGAPTSECADTLGSLLDEDELKFVDRILRGKWQSLRKYIPALQLVPTNSIFMDETDDYVRLFQDGLEAMWDTFYYDENPF